MNPDWLAACEKAEQALHLINEPPPNCEQEVIALALTSIACSLVVIASEVQDRLDVKDGKVRSVA